jgi:hypothetical protein
MMGFGIESRPSLTVKSGSAGGGDVVIVVLQHFVDHRYLIAPLKPISPRHFFSVPQGQITEDVAR